LTSLEGQVPDCNSNEVMPATWIDQTLLPFASAARPADFLAKIHFVDFAVKRSPADAEPPGCGYVARSVRDVADNFHCGSRKEWPATCPPSPNANSPLIFAFRQQRAWSDHAQHDCAEMDGCAGKIGMRNLDRCRSSDRENRGGH